jgi:hypothetical protein
MRFFLLSLLVATVPSFGQEMKSLGCLFEISKFAQNQQLQSRMGLARAVAASEVGEQNLGLATAFFDRLKEGQRLAAALAPLLEMPRFADVLGGTLLRLGITTPHEIEALGSGQESTVFHFAEQMVLDVRKALGPNPLGADNLPLAKAWGYSVATFADYQTAAILLRNEDAAAAFAYWLLREPERIHRAIFGKAEHGVAEFAGRQLAFILKSRPSLSHFFQKAPRRKYSPFQLALAEELTEAASKLDGVSQRELLRLAIDHSREDLARLTMGVVGRLIYFSRTTPVLTETFADLTLACALAIVSASDFDFAPVEEKLTADASGRFSPFSWFKDAAFGPSFANGDLCFISWVGLGIVATDLTFVTAIRFYTGASPGYAAVIGALCPSLMIGGPAGLLVGSALEAVCHVLGAVSIPAPWRKHPAKTTEQLNRTKPVQNFRRTLEGQ